MQTNRLLKIHDLNSKLNFDPTFIPGKVGKSYEGCIGNHG